MNKNSEKPMMEKLENVTFEWAKQYFCCNFVIKKAGEIGNLPKKHKFDHVSENESIVI